MAKLVLPHALGNAARDVRLLALRVARRRGSACARRASPRRAPSPTRCAAPGTSCRAARCRRSRSRTTRSRARRGSARCTCSSGLQGHATSAARARAACRPSACTARSRRRCRARRAAAVPMRVMIRMFTTTYGRVGDLARRSARSASRAAPCRTARRTSCGPRMQPANRPRRICVQLPRVHPVVGRAGVVFAARADERAVLDARDVAADQSAQRSCSGASRDSAG